MSSTPPRAPLAAPASPWLGLAGWVGLSLLTGAAGAIASRDAAPFYAQLSRPSWAPPAWLFGPVWSALYPLMGIAAWLVWRKAGWNGARTALVLFVAQLVANGLWSWCFFAWKTGAFAFADVVAMEILIIATIVAFAPVSRLAAALLLPYILWVSFATALTFSVWQRNPSFL